MFLGNHCTLTHKCLNKSGILHKFVFILQSIHGKNGVPPSKGGINSYYNYSKEDKVVFRSKQKDPLCSYNYIITKGPGQVVKFYYRGCKR